LRDGFGWVGGVAGSAVVLVLDVPVHAAHCSELFAADHADSFPRVILLVIVPGAWRRAWAVHSIK